MYILEGWGQQFFASQLSTEKSKWAVALKCLRLSRMEARSLYGDIYQLPVAYMTLYLNCKALHKMKLARPVNVGGNMRGARLLPLAIPNFIRSETPRLIAIIWVVGGLYGLTSVPVLHCNKAASHTGTEYLGDSALSTSHTVSLTSTKQNKQYSV